MADIEHARGIINEVDAQMAELFVRRMKAAEEVAAYKKERGLPILDAARENVVIEQNAARVAEPYKAYYVSFLRALMEQSRGYQHFLNSGMRVAFSGVEGAFADVAARKIFPDAETCPCTDFAAAYRAVEQGKCEVAVLPLENSYNGDVGQVMDLAFFGPLFVHQIRGVEVVQHLLGVPGATVSDVREVVSHPQALGQCAEYIRNNGLAVREAVNTAVAAKEVAAIGKKEIAAIGSEEAAKAYGLVKLEAHINTSGGNTTRFAVFSSVKKEHSDADDAFVLLFTVNNEAGSLGRAIDVIGRYGFNLRALKSRPTKKLSWSYYFYAEGEGNIYSLEGQRMLAALKGCCNDLKVLGSFIKE